MPDYAAWLGKQNEQHDIVTPSGVDRFRATLGWDADGDNVPYAYHWCLCLPDAKMSELGEDGHPVTGGFLPKSDLPGRMWASSKVEFLAPIKVGAHVERISKIKSITPKSGKTGELLFVDVEHLTRSDGQDAVSEVQTIVYREHSKSKSVAPEPAKHDVSEWDHTSAFVSSTRLLFRYSALTFNTHRIHYDLPYASQQEGYPKLVVHGPLMASLLLKFAASIKPEIVSFEFRGRAPAYCGERKTLVAKENSDVLELAIIGCDGRMIMSAKAKTN